MVAIFAFGVNFGFMGRHRRIALGRIVYQVMNRANGRLRIFRKDERFTAKGAKIISRGRVSYGNDD